MKKLNLCLFIILMISILVPDFVYAKQLGKSKKKEDVVNQSIDLIDGELMRIGIKRVNELIKFAQANSNLELFSKLAQIEQVKNPNNSSDKALYAAKQEVIDKDDPLIDEFANFFLKIKKNCKKMKKVYVYSQSSEDEPIGQAFRLVIPGKIAKGEYSCNHYTISFRIDVSGELLVTEWYSMPQNSDCQ